MPLHTAPLLLIVCFSLLLSIAQTAGLVGLPLLLIITSWFFKYSFVLLDHVVEGKHQPPVLDMEMVNPVEQRPFGLLLLMLGFYVVTMQLESALTHTGVLSLRIVALLIVPAMMGAMSATGRFVDALNPLAVLGLIARIPLAYGALLITIASLWAGLWLVPMALLKMAGWGSAASGFVEQIIFMYLWLAMCACIGGLMYEQRHELGFEPAHSPERTQARHQAAVERERDRLLDPIFAQCRGGAFANAGSAVRALIENSPQPLTEFRWLYARAAQWPDQCLAEYLVQLCLPRLLEARATGEALDLIRARLSADSKFRPATSAQLLRVALLARAAGDRATARQLLADFAVHFPNDAAAAMAVQIHAELQR